MFICYIFFFNDTATTEIYTLSLHDALPIYGDGAPPECPHTVRAVDDAGDDHSRQEQAEQCAGDDEQLRMDLDVVRPGDEGRRSEEHTSELQSRQYLVCRLLLEKKKKTCTHL